MAGLKEIIFPKVANKIGIRRLTKVDRAMVVHPFFHAVSDKYCSHISPLYSIKTVREFEKDLDFILSYFQPVSINEFYEHNKENKVFTRHSFHLSFDDGLREVYETALPILKRKGIPATIFINSSFVDNKNLFFRHKAALLVEKLDVGKISLFSQEEAKKRLGKTDADSLRPLILGIKYKNKQLLDELAEIFEISFSEFLLEQKPYLTLKELMNMQSQGFTIGSHSIDHPIFSELDKVERSRQLNESVDFVKTRFGEKHSFFAFPFSDENIEPDFFDELYRTVDLSFGITGMGVHRNGKHIDRVDMENYGITAEEALNKAILKYRMKKCLSRT